MRGDEAVAAWALLAGVAAGVGLLVGLYGTARALRTLRRIRLARGARALSLVAVADVALLAGMTVAALLQLVAAALLASGSPYLAAAAYAAQVAVVNLAAPCYLAFRTLALLEGGDGD